MEIDGLLVDCDAQWICNLPCDGDEPYYNWLPTDGFIDIQTNFYDSQRDNPTTGFGTWINVEICDATGNYIDALPYLSEHTVGWSGDYSYQTIRVDASTITWDCFHFKFSTTDTQEDVCTQDFKIDRQGCESLVKLEGVHTKKDCWENWYGTSEGGFSGTSDFEYSNAIYVPGVLKYYGSETSVDEENNKLRGVDSTSYYRLILNSKIPPYLMRYLTQKVMVADYLLVNDEQYENSGLGRTNPVSDKSSMFLPILEFKKESCDSSDLKGACE